MMRQHFSGIATLTEGEGKTEAKEWKSWGGSTIL